MTYLGTRPPTVDEWEKYELHHRSRMSTKPGITGMWQVSGRSDITDFEEVVRLDTEYIEHWTIGLDIKILIKTVLAVVKHEGYVNETVRLSLYGDFLYPLAGESTLEAFYKEKPEGEFCPELLAARKVVWEILRPYRMKLLRLSPAKFLHFGTTAEILKLMTQGTLHYSHLGWKSKINSSVGQNPSYDRDGTNLISRNIWKSGRPELAQASARPGSVAALNSILSTNAECGEDCYLEVSY